MASNTYESLDVSAFGFKNDIVIYRQPCAAGLFSPLKTVYQELVERLYRNVQEQSLDTA